MKSLWLIIKVRVKYQAKNYQKVNSKCWTKITVYFFVVGVAIFWYSNFFTQNRNNF